MSAICLRIALDGLERELLLVGGCGKSERCQCEWQERHDQGISHQDPPEALQNKANGIVEARVPTGKPRRSFTNRGSVGVRTDAWEGLDGGAIHAAGCAGRWRGCAGAWRRYRNARRHKQAKPNIVFIMADDLGYADVSCYGRREYTTANIDRLAQGGMRFTQAYANSAVCSATRTALITGRYQYRYPVGLEEPLNTRDVGLSPDVPTLPSLLKKAGYATALIGKWHLGARPKYGPEKSGYDRFYGFEMGSSDYFNHANSLWDGQEKANDEGYLTNLLGDRAVATVEDFARARNPSSSACISTRRIGRGKAPRTTR